MRRAVAPRAVAPRAAYVLLGVLGCYAAGAHSVSDAYLTLVADKSGVLHGQWDIALRDLDFAIDLDKDGQGHLTWGEVRRSRARIEDYAYRFLKFDVGSRNHCVITPLKQMIDQHADGAYAALMFDVTCAGAASITLNYNLFFAIDPSHRAIFVGRKGDDVATAVLAPQNSTIVLP